MAGHSKWANRKHRKERQDEKKGKVFSKMAREIMVAARQGGPNPEANARLRLAIAKARDARMPMENIERAIQRGAGGAEGEELEELTYEGYGPGGVAILLEILTNNRNRTAGEIRHIFSRHGGNLGESGCVAWMFNRTGLVTVPRDENAVDEDQVLALALEAGADDVTAGEDSFQVTVAPERLEEVRAHLERVGLKVRGEITYLPTTEVDVRGKDAEQLYRLLDALEDHDDVQEVHTNWAMAEEELERLGT